MSWEEIKKEWDEKHGGTSTSQGQGSSTGSSKWDTIKKEWDEKHGSSGTSGTPSPTGAQGRQGATLGQITLERQSGLLPQQSQQRKVLPLLQQAREQRRSVSPSLGQVTQLRQAEAAPLTFDRELRRTAEQASSAAKAQAEQERVRYGYDESRSGRSDAGYYTDRVQQAVQARDYDAAAFWMDKLVQAPLTAAERQKATDYINSLYGGDSIQAPFGSAPDAASKLVSAYDKDIRSFTDLLDSEDGSALLREVAERYGISARLAYSDPDAYIEAVRAARGQDQGRQISDQARLDYETFAGGQQNYLTQNAMQAFLRRGENELRRAAGSESASSQMQSYTRAQLALMALDQLYNYTDAGGNYGDGTRTEENATTAYLINELKGYGVDLSGLNEGNFRERLDRAIGVQQQKVERMRSVLRQTGYDTDAVYEYIRFSRESAYEAARSGSVRSWVEAQRQNTNPDPVIDALLHAVAPSLLAMDMVPNRPTVTEGAVNQGIASLMTVAENSALSQFMNIPTWARFGAGGGNANRPNEYIPIAPQTKDADLMRGAISGQMSGVGSFLYNALMSWADSTANAAMFGGVGGAAQSALGETAARVMTQIGTLSTMGANAATSKANEILQRGGNRAQAVIGGLAAGAVEAATEIWSVENLIRLSDGVGYKQFLKEFTKSFVSESSEEIAGDVLDRAIDNLNMGNLSEDSAAVRKYVKQGMTLAEAKKQVLIDNTISALEAGLSGGLSGAFSTVLVGGPSAVQDAAAGTANYFGGKLDKATEALDFSDEGRQDSWLINPERQSTANAALADEYFQRLALLEQGLEERISPSGQNAAALDSSSPLAPQNDMGGGAAIAQNSLSQSQADSPLGEAAMGGQVARATGNRNDSVADMSAVYEKNGQAVETALQRINDDGTVTLADGHVARIGELQMDPDVKSTLQELTRAVQGETANVMLALYQSEGERALVDALTLYDTAQRGVSQQTAVNQVKNLPSAVAAQVWKLGNQAFRQWSEVQSVAAGRSSGKVDLSGIRWGRLTQTQRSQVLIAAKIAKAVGVDVTFYESKTRTDANGKTRYVGALGSYRNGAIRLDVNAGANYTADLNDGMMKAMSHELTHFIEQYSRAEYAKLKGFVFEVLTEKYGAEGVERLIQEKIARAGKGETSSASLRSAHSPQGESLDSSTSLRSAQNDKTGGLTRAEAESEVVADGCEMLLRDSQAVQELVARDRTLGERIADWLRRFVEKLKSVFGQTQREEARAVMEQAEQAQQLWDNALKAAAQAHSETSINENTALNGGAVRYSLREYSNQQKENWKNSRIVVYAGNTNQIKQFVDNAKKGNLNGKKLYFGAVNDDLAQEIKLRTGLDVNHYNLSLSAYEVQKIFHDHSNDGEVLRGQKPIEIDDFVYIPFVVQNADSIFRSKKDYNGKPVIEFVADIDSKRRMNVTVVVSSKHLDIFVQTMYINQKTGSLSTPTDEQASVNTPEASSGTASSGNSIFDSSGKSNPSENIFSEQFSERDYTQPSDVELVMNATAAETANREQAQMLESAQKQQQKIERLQAQLDQREVEIAELEAQMKTTDRALNTRGISGVVRSIMTEMGMGDANQKGVAKHAVERLTEMYAETLTQIDKGDMDGAWVHFTEKSRQLAEYLIDNGTYTEQVGYRWEKADWSQQFAASEADRMSAVHDIMASITADFVRNRYRDAMQPTKADRLVERTAKKYEAKLSAKNEQLAQAQAENRSLTQENDNLRRWRELTWGNEKGLREVIDRKQQQLEQARAEAKQSGKVSQRQQAKIEALEESVRQLREERDAWRGKAQHNATLARQFAESKNRDLRLQQRQSQKALEGALKEKQAMARDLERRIAREKDILAGRLRPRQMQQLLAQERQKAAEAVRVKKEQQFKDYKDRKAAAALRQKIGNLRSELQRAITNPTDRRFVPVNLAGAMADVLEVLDTSPREGTKAAAKYQNVSEAVRALADAYEGLAKDEDYTFKSEYNDEIRDELRQLAETMQGRNLRELSLEELQTVYDTVKSIRDTMRNATKLLSSEQFASVYEAMDSVVAQQQSMQSMNQSSKAEQNKRLRLLDNLSVMRAVEMMANWDRGAALYQLMHNIEQGVVASDGWVMDYNKAMQELKTGKNEKAYRDALTKRLDFGVTDADGLQVRMTKLQALQIFMTAEREAHNDKLVHLQRGGAVIRDALAIQDGKAGKAISQRIAVTPELLATIQERLTDWDRQYMQAVRAYFAKESKAVNRVQNRLKHNVLVTEEYYVPYIVDKNYLDTKLTEEGAMNMWVKAPGSTNTLVQNARQPVVIDGMDTVMARHVREMADYINLALPVRDFSKVYNGRLSQGEGELALPVKETIDRNFGDKGRHLLTQAVIEVQGGGRSQNWSTHISEMLSALQSAFVKSALLINPSVTIKQAASYTAAESILSHRALIAGNRPIFSSTDGGHSVSLIAQLFAVPNGRAAQRIFNEIDQHTSMHYQRRLGMSMQELANEALRSSALKRTINSVGASMEQTTVGHAVRKVGEAVRKVGEALNPTQWIQRMDVATTAALWVACKEQARMDLGLDSSAAPQNDKYWGHVTELYEQVLRETQPMYDSMHRSANQKQHEGLMQYLFPFRTVSIQNHGQIATAYEAWNASKNKSKAEQQAAAKHLMKTVWANTESAVVFSVMTFLAAAMKRKTSKYRDDDDEFTVESVLKGIGVDTLSVWVSNLFPLFGSEMYDYVERAIDAITGKSNWSFDTFSVGLVDMLNQFAKNGEALLKETGKLMRGDGGSWESVGEAGLNLALQTAKLFGIPADTIRTYWKGMAANVQDIAAGRVPAINNEAVERSASTNANRYLKAWLAGDDEKRKAVFEEMLTNYQASGKSEEEARDTAKAAIVKAVKTSDLEDEQTIHILVESGFFDENEAYWKVREWNGVGKYDRLEAAVDVGGSIDEAVEELTGHGVSIDTVRKKTTDYVKDSLTAGAIDAETAVELLVRYNGKDENEAYWQVQKWSASAAHEDDEDYSYSKYETLYAAIDGNQDPAEAVQELLDHGTKESDATMAAKSYIVGKFEDGSYTEEKLRNYLSRYCGIVKREEVDKIVNNAKCYKEVGVHYNDLKDAYVAGTLDGSKAQQALAKYGGMSSTEAQNRVRYWQFTQDYPEADLSEDQVTRYYVTKPDVYGKTMQQAGISMKVYIDYCTRASACKGTDANGDGKTDSGSKKKQVMAEIDRLPLTKDQKDALYYLNGWAKSKIYEAPWH